ncbi:hypothetical protein D3C87_1156010 [compost metagenome]
MNCSCPFCHKSQIVVWIGVYSKPIDTRIFNPPNMALQNVLLNIFIFLIHVGHSLYKPSFFHSVSICNSSIGIENSLILISGLCKTWPLMQPFFKRFVDYSPVVKSYMIWNDIMHQFHFTFMQFLTKFTIGLIGSQSWINLIIFGICISMIRSLRHIIGQYRCQPNRSNP